MLPKGKGGCLFLWSSKLKLCWNNHYKLCWRSNDHCCFQNCHKALPVTRDKNLEVMQGTWPWWKKKKLYLRPESSKFESCLSVQILCAKWKFIFWMQILYRSHIITEVNSFGFMDLCMYDYVASILLQMSVLYMQIYLVFFFKCAF